MIFWKVLNTVCVVGSCLVLGVAVWLDPDPRGFGTHEQLDLPPCHYLELTGSPCVTCGMTTSFSNMIRLNVVGAWNANPMGLVLFLLTCTMPPWFGHALWTGKDPFRFVAGRLGRWLLPAVVAGLFGCWMLRV